MAQKSSKSTSFWKELKRRKVIRVTTVYAATAFIILQLVDLIAEPLHFPEWTQGFIIVLLCIGLIITIIVSWIYDITPAGVKKTKPASAVKHTDHTTHPVSRGWMIATYVSGVIIIALVVFNVINRRNLNADISKLEKSIAVLPFKLLSDEPDKQYLADGIMDAILLHLSKIDALRVMSRTSTEQYRIPGKTMTDIGKELGVNYLLEGSFQKSGDDVRLIVQLIRTGKEGHLWAKQYDRNWKDIFKVQSEVAEAIASELNAVILPEKKRLIEKVPTANLEAYDLYLKATNYSMEFTSLYNLNSYQKAVTFFKAAIEIDSLFAGAYSSLAGLYALKYTIFGFSKIHLDSCHFLADKALSIDDQLDEAYVAKGTYYWATGQNIEALESLNKALRINPNSYNAFNWKGTLFLFGLDNTDFVAGIDNLHKALNLVQGSLRLSSLQGLMYAYQGVGFFKEAENYNLEVLKIKGDSSFYFSGLAMLEISKGDYTKAAMLSEKAMKDPMGYLRSLLIFGLAGQDQKAYNVAKSLADTMGYLKRSGNVPYNYMQRIGYAFWKAGRYKEADYYFDEQIRYALEGIKQGSFYSSAKWAYYDLAGVYAFKGDKENAYKCLDEFNTMDFHPSWLLSQTKHDPLFESIRDEERFQRILQNMEAKYQTEHERVRRWLEEQGML